MKIFAVFVAAIAPAAFAASTAHAFSEAKKIPPPAADTAAPASSELRTAVFAGGCFWGVQGVFQHVKGVTNAVSGYAGGKKNTARYEMIGSGRTGHAEAVEITFDPKTVSYGELLQIFFSVAHDPTQLNRQGPDEGTQYRSTIFPADAEQARAAKAYIAQLDAAKAFDARIATTIESAPFYPAEDYHQDYMVLNPAKRYIVVNDLPKVESLKRLFPGLYSADPALVAEAKTNG